MVAALPLSALSCEGLSEGPRGRVVEVTDGDTIVLDSGIKVRLIGIQAPKLPLGREDFKAWPLAGEARTALAGMVMGDEVILRYGQTRMDRHGRALAQVFVAGGRQIWVQQALLEAGLARVYSFADNRLCLDELYDAEAGARAGRRGLWAHAFYQPRRADRPEELLPLAGRYELVEGRVLKADRAGARVYLNFGRLWKEDFTIVIERAAQKLFAQAGRDPLAYEGLLVRVRGWIDDRDGPRIEVTHPEQIEVLSTK